MVSEKAGGRKAYMKEKKRQCQTQGRGQVSLVLKSVKGILYSDKDSLNKRESQKSNLGEQGWTVSGIDSIAC